MELEIIEATAFLLCGFLIGIYVGGFVVDVFHKVENNKYFKNEDN